MALRPEQDRPRQTSISDEEWRHRIKVPKKLIICCDGTWMDSDNGWVEGKWGKADTLQNPTNVTRIARAIKDEDDGHHPQIVYYQAGIGTGIGLYNHLVGGGTGLGIDENIREAYAFLASNYSEHSADVEPDSIFLLGFSRGAYTARSLAGLVCALGILRRRAMAHFCEMFYDWEMAGDPKHTPLFFNSYFEHHHDVKKAQPPISLARDKTRRDEYLELYRRHLLDLDLTQEARINCVGVWDTVGALGIPVNPFLQRLFPSLPSFLRKSKWFDTRLDHRIDYAFHALALDERRFPYSPAIWEKRTGCTTHLKQVWFPGAHSNVGGSYPDAGVADITLTWMMDQLAGLTVPHPDGFKSHQWIKFDDEYVDHWYACQADWYQRHRLDEYKPWGRGKVYDSNTFPQSLAGAKVREPGRYHRTFYESGKQDPKHLLADTREYVHSCVRTRIDLAGRGVETDWSQVFPKGWNFKPLFEWVWQRLTGWGTDVYQPHRKGGPLEGWRLEDGHESHVEPNLDIQMKADNVGEVRWVYEGRGAVQSGVMMEDRLGPYERRLLLKDAKIAQEVLYTNNGWKHVEELVEMVVRSAKTI